MCDGWYISASHSPTGHGFCTSLPHVCPRSRVVKERSANEERGCHSIHAEYVAEYQRALLAGEEVREQDQDKWGVVIAAANEDDDDGGEAAHSWEAVRDRAAEKDEADDLWRATWWSWYDSGPQQSWYSAGCKTTHGKKRSTSITSRTMLHE